MSKNAIDVPIYNYIKTKVYFNTNHVRSCQNGSYIDILTALDKRIANNRIFSESLNCKFFCANKYRIRAKITKYVEITDGCIKWEIVRRASMRESLCF